MEPVTARKEASEAPTLYMAIEIGERQWKLGFSIGMGQRPRMRVIEARQFGRLEAEIRAAKARFKLCESAPVSSCYEAGREGFWPHRALTKLGVKNVVVDSSSIEVNRRARRAKSDKLDVVKLCEQLIRYHAGERRVWSVVRVPTVAQEDQRQLQRALMACRRDRSRVVVRVKSLLCTQGPRLGQRGTLPRNVTSLKRWDGEPLPEQLCARIEREAAKATLLDGQIREMERRRKHWLKNGSDPVLHQVRKLFKLRAIGIETAWLLPVEIFSWRKFRNVRELGALLGLCPTPHQSGIMSRELGITKAGNRYLRAQMIEIAWGWVRYQPQSALTQWYVRKYGPSSSAQRRKGIVALARKLVVALWKYLEHDEIPAGAMLKG
jgi:transposase